MFVKLMTDYRCWPLWVRASPAEVFNTLDPATLGLTPSLVGRLNAWQQWYESMVNIADPNDSRSVSASEDAALEAEGRLLAVRVARELPLAAVWFHLDPEPGG
jgi:hypothetical protein